MSSTEQAEPKKKRTRRRKGRVKQQTFVFDAETQRDLANIQLATRAVSATEAVKTAIRRFAQMTRYRAKGYEIQARLIDADGNGESRTVVLDVPGGKRVV
jgi:hypothetical protein